MNDDWSFYTGDRVQDTNGARGVVIARLWLIDTTTDAPVERAARVRYDDGRELVRPAKMLTMVSKRSI